MFAHGLAIRPCKLWAECTNALVQLLYLGFSQYSAWWLGLQSINESRKKVDVFGLDRTKFIVASGHDGSIGRLPIIGV